MNYVDKFYYNYRDWRDKYYNAITNLDKSMEHEGYADLQKKYDSLSKRYKQLKKNLGYTEGDLKILEHNLDREKL